MSGTIRTVALLIRGRVQGVGYRMWTRREAERHGLSGHVRNRPDGAVEALVSGAPEAVEAMIAACHRGPAGASVSEVAVTEGPDAQPATGFTILPD